MQDAVHRPQQRRPSFVMEDDDDAGGGQGGAPLEFLVDAPPREKSGRLSKTGWGGKTETKHPLSPRNPMAGEQLLAPVALSSSPLGFQLISTSPPVAGRVNHIPAACRAPVSPPLSLLHLLSTDNRLLAWGHDDSFHTRAGFLPPIQAFFPPQNPTPPKPSPAQPLEQAGVAGGAML